MGDGDVKIRSVVTGHDADGKSVFLSDRWLEGTHLSLLPGLELHTLWASRPPVTCEGPADTATGMSWFPPAGGVRFFHMVLPPEGGEPVPPDDPDAAAAEMEAQVPGLLATMEPDHPGMHRSDTVDCLFVLSGHPVLELDEGAEVRLSPGDAVVQRGTRHRWHNREGVAARMLGFHLGCRRPEFDAAGAP